MEPEILVEANTHMDHMDDMLFLYGIDGLRDAINFAISAMQELKGSRPKNFATSVKWDGAPAVIFGQHPETKKFFVGTKSVFAKNSKVNYTPADIDRNHPGSGLNEKLKVCLKYLPLLRLKGIYQGDLLFTPSDLKKQKIDGEDFITFQPNTIVYSIPTNSKLSSEVLKSKLGIVIHTKYTGSLVNPRTEFAPKLRLPKTSSVWATSAEMPVANVGLTSSESALLKDLLSSTGKMFRTLDSTFIKELISSPLKDLIMIHTNQKVRGGELVGSPAAHIQDLIRFVNERIQKDVDSVKTEVSKAKKKEAGDQILSVIEKNKKQLIACFSIQQNLQLTKNILIQKFQKLDSGMKMFTRTGDNYQVTNPEGFVLINRITGNAVKLVDRLEFSRQNFLATKTWEK